MEKGDAREEEERAISAWTFRAMVAGVVVARLV
jgi:hypothetical protein